MNQGRRWGCWGAGEVPLALNQVHVATKITATPTAAHTARTETSLRCSPSWAP